MSDTTAIDGLSETALVPRLINVVATSSPRQLARDVGSTRGAVNNLATAAANAVVAALLISLLDARHYAPVRDASIRVALRSFVSNDRLRHVLAQTSATSEQVSEAVRVNTAARLGALKTSFFALAGLALLASITFRRKQRKLDARAAQNATRNSCGSSAQRTETHSGGSPLS